MWICTHLAKLLATLLPCGTKECKQGDLFLLIRCSRPHSQLPCHEHFADVIYLRLCGPRDPQNHGICSAVFGAKKCQVCRQKRCYLCRHSGDTLIDDLFLCRLHPHKLDCFTNNIIYRQTQL